MRNERRTTLLRAVRCLVELPLFVGRAAQLMPPPVGRCRNEPGDPITVEMVRAAFAARGIELFDDPHGCCAPQQVAHLVNVAHSGPHANLGEARSIHERVGMVFCSVDHRPYLYRAPDDRTLLVEGLPSGKRGFRIEYANVTCRLYPAKNKPEAQLERVVETMKALGQTLSPAPAMWR